jgi:hypothetical protein
MKSFLSILLKAIIALIFTSLSFHGFAASITVGSGSGAISVTSQGVLTPGDTIYVVAGTYGSYSTISNISGSPGHNIIVIPKSGVYTVAFTGGVNFLNDKYITVEYFENNTHSNGWDMRGDQGNSGGKTNVSNVFFTHMHFANMAGFAFTNYNNEVYNYTTQDTTTTACYKCKFDSITVDNCGGFIQGSFGTVGNGIDVCLNDTFTHVLFNNMVSNGKAFGGIQFRVLCAYITVHQTSNEPYAGDMGVFTFGGGGQGFNGTIHDVYIDGPVAVWIARINAYALFGSTTDSCLFYNIQATNKSSFGGIVIQSLAGDLIAGKVASCNAAVFNVSLGNCPTQNTFWNYTVDIGSGLHAQTVHIKNCIGFNNAFTGKTPGVIIDESSGSSPTYDSSHNTYGPSATYLSLDSSGIWPTYAPLPTSFLVGLGIATPYTTGGQLDLAGHQWNAVPSEGPYMVSVVGDFTAPNRGAQHWNSANWDGTNNPLIPAGNGTAKNYYYRFNWQDIESNTVQGSYNWTTFDNVVQGAMSVGAMFTVGVMDFCSACGSLGVVPQYVQNLMTTEGKPCWNNGGIIVPNYQSTQWANRYIVLMHAVANHIATTSFGGHTYTSAFLGWDQRHYGDFGEGNGYPTGTAPAGAQVTDAYLMKMTDSALAIFPNVQSTVPMSYVAPNNNYSNAAGNTGTQAAYHELTVSNAYGRVGWRRDNIGDSGYNGYLTQTTAVYNPGTGNVALQPLIMQNWRVAPIGGEPANDLAALTRGGPIMFDLHHEDSLFGMSYFGNGNYPVAANDPTYGATLTANMRAGSAEEGYRLILDGESNTTSPNSGGPFNITLNWKNTGIAPVYEKWNVTYELRNGSTVVWTGTSKFTSRLFLPNTVDSVVSDNFVLTGVAPGTYNLYLIIRDPAGYKQPLQLAITGQQSDGSYVLRSSVTVTDINTLIVVWGESNAAGNADNAPAPLNQLGIRNEVQILDHNTSKFSRLNIGGNNEQNTFISSPDSPTTKHGPELGMANEVDSGNLRNPVYMVKIGVSGSYICQWLHEDGTTCRPSGNLWDGWIPFVDSAVSQMQKLGKPFKIVVWQSIGLNDLYQQNTPASTFFNNMALFRSDFRTRYGDNTIQFYGTNFNNPPQQSYAWGYLLDSMAKVDPYYHSIPVTGASYIDGGVHWDYIGMKLVVTNIVDSMVQVSRPPSTVTSNAGPNQTIVQPASSVTVDGSASTGPITGYLWTQISGPTTATITSPTSVVTTITSLIGGNYIFQLAVNAGASTSQITIFVQPPIVGATIFTNQTPVAPTDNDHQPTVGQEVGVRFTTSVPGFITGVRFYKTTGNSGTHTGELYDNAGNRLAQAVFTGETATGWQNVSFSSPVAINANTTYVAAYFSSLGYYVEDNGYFASTWLTNAPLTALQDGANGCNGPFLYSAAPAFPTSCFSSANYWVDVFFSQNIVTPCNCVPSLRKGVRKIFITK